PPERSGGGFPGLAYFFRWAEKISAADGRRWGQRWTHEFSIVVRTTIIRRRKEVPVRQQAPGEVDAKGVRDAPESCVWFPAGGSLPRCRVGLRNKYKTSAAKEQFSYCISRSGTDAGYFIV